MAIRNKRTKNTFVILSPILLLLVFAIPLTLQNPRHELLAATALAKNSTNTNNLTNSSGVGHVNNNNTATTTAGSEHIYRGGAAAGVGGE